MAAEPPLRPLALVAAGLGLLTACGPIPRERAERLCAREAEAAQRPRGSVAIGAGTGGPAARFELDISTDYLLRRDPSQVYANCVYRRSGQPPSQPFTLRPERKG